MRRLFVGLLDRREPGGHPGLDPGTPDWGFQGTTAVLPAHRGHRLGLLVKAEMLDLLAAYEPAACHILTGNAGSNQHMIANNEQLGFEGGPVYRSWEFYLSAVPA